MAASTKHKQSIYGDVKDANIAQMQENLLFDHKLREKASVKEGGDAFKRYKFQKRWLSKVKLVALIVYYFVVPFF